MRCVICDRLLTDKEVQFNDQTNKLEPCTNCLDEALVAAFGVEFDDDEIDTPYWSNEYAEPEGELEEDDDEIRG